LTPHTTADDPKRYRTEEEYNLWDSREPLKRFRKYLESKSLLSAEEDAKLEAEIDVEIKQAMQRVEILVKSEELSNPLTMFDYLYADSSGSLQSQRDELAQYLQSKKKKGSGKNNPQKSEAPVE
jgi:TPP-dependent pyruvate/acetoin dehydrogenase alpha subunit